MRYLESYCRHRRCIALDRRVPKFRHPSPDFATGRRRARSEDAAQVARPAIQAVEHMKTEPRGELDAHLHTPPAVAVLIEARRVGADAELPVDNGDDAASNPALGGHADAVRPLTRIVMHAA